MRGGFSYSSFFIFFGNDSYDEATCGPKRLYKLQPLLDDLNAKFRSLYAGVWCASRWVFDDVGYLLSKVYFLQNVLDFGIKSFELHDAKFGYV
jgi:hypothetical protein